jgi:hypothetical protein
LDGEACLYISIVDAWDHPSAATWYTSSSKLEWQMWFFNLIFADSGRRDVYVSEFWSKAGITYMDGHGMPSMSQWEPIEQHGETSRILVVRARPDLPIRYHSVFLPAWEATALAGLPAALVIGWRIVLRAIYRRRAARLGHGFCANCGYDLRATPDLCRE